MRTFADLAKAPIRRKPKTTWMRMVHRMLGSPWAGAPRQECPFCGEEETNLHLFFTCSRLKDWHALLGDWLSLPLPLAPTCFILMQGQPTAIKKLSWTVLATEYLHECWRSRCERKHRIEEGVGEATPAQLTNEMRSRAQDVLDALQRRSTKFLPRLIGGVVQDVDGSARLSLARRLPVHIHQAPPAEDLPPLGQ